MPQPIWINGDVLATLLETVPATLEYDDVGLVGGAITYLVKWEFAAALVRTLKYHPDYSWLKRSSATITREEADLARVEVEFEGIDPNDEDDGDKKVYTLEGTSSQEPIESHPNFHAFAGDWKNQKLAISNPRFQTEVGPDQGKFLGFTPLVQGGSGKINPYAGVESYLSPGFIYTERSVEAKAPSGATISADMNKLGEVDTPPDSDVMPELNPDSGFEWLLVGASIREVGDGVEISKRWRLSGRRGWLNAIYDPSTW
jgi:hypothetical protein